MLRAKEKDAAKQFEGRRIFCRRTLRGVAGRHSCAGARRIAGAGADGGVVPFPAENRRSRSRRNTVVIATMQSFVVAASYHFGAADARGFGSVRGARRAILPPPRAPHLA